MHAVVGKYYLKVFELLFLLLVTETNSNFIYCIWINGKQQHS